MVMALTCAVFIATSLDGFIARTNGSIDWLEEANSAVTPGEDFGYHAFMASVDVLIMGRNTFETALGFGEWPYGDKPVVVLSSRLKSLPPEVQSSVSLENEEPAVLVARLAAEGRTKAYVDGGLTIQRFLAADLVDEITITRIPVLIGEGRALFGPLPRDRRLRHVATRAWDCGFVQSTYRVEREG